MLTEDTRAKQISDSRNRGEYKDKSFGRNRFERKRLSKIANQTKSYNQIDMNMLFKQDTLQVEIPVIGETKEYQVVIKVSGVIEELSKNIKNNQNQFDYRAVFLALTRCLNTRDIYTKCSCDDFKYRFAHWNVVHNRAVNGTADDPGAGKGIANPKDDKGSGCKHILLVLANLEWVNKVASVINNYIRYAEINFQKPFLDIIVPKLYGFSASSLGENNMVDPEKADGFLESSKGLIDAINEWGRIRGRFKPGSNQNTANGVVVDRKAQKAQKPPLETK